MKLFSILTAAACLLVVSACASTPEPTDERVHVIEADGAEDIQPGNIYISADAAKVFTFRDVESEINENGYLAVRVFGKTCELSALKWAFLGDVDYEFAYRFYWLDADEGLSMIPDAHYDVAICSDTLQEVKNPRGLLHEALRIADEAIVTFPNFAAYRIRLTLALTGRLPVSKALPFKWYDTPNIHCVTLKDFEELCKAEGIEIVEVAAESRHPFGKLLLALGMKNLGASKIVARIRRKKEKAQ